LLDTDTHGTLGVGEQFDEVSVCERVVTDVVAGRVCEEEDERGDLRSLIFGAVGIGDLETLESDGHGHEDHGHGSSGKHEHPATAESSDDEGDSDTVDQTPALVGDVDARLGVLGGVSHHLE